MGKQRKSILIEKSTNVQLPRRSDKSEFQDEEHRRLRLIAQLNKRTATRKGTFLKLLNKYSVIDETAEFNLNNISDSPVDDKNSQSNKSKRPNTDIRFTSSPLNKNSLLSPPRFAYISTPIIVLQSAQSTANKNDRTKLREISTIQDKQMEIETDRRNRFLINFFNQQTTMKNVSKSDTIVSKYLCEPSKSSLGALQSPPTVYTSTPIVGINNMHSDGNSNHCLTISQNQLYNSKNVTKQRTQNMIGDSKPQNLPNVSMAIILNSEPNEIKQVTSNIFNGKLVAEKNESKTKKQPEEPYFLRKIPIKNQPPTREKSGKCFSKRVNGDFNNEAISFEQHVCHGKRIKTKPLDFLKVFMQKACKEMKKKDDNKYGHLHVERESVRSTRSEIRDLCCIKRADPFREFLAQQYELMKRQRQEHCD